MDLRQMTRKELLITWLFGSILLMLITSVISMLVWHVTLQADPSNSLHPIDHLPSMAFRVPVGWFLSFLNLFGWVNILFFFLSILTKSALWLAGSAIAVILSGILWPMLHVTMIGL